MEEASSGSLFENEADLEDFRSRQAAHKVRRGDLSQFSGDCYLGIDAGSPTKLALIDSEGKLLYSYYSNHGGPLDTTSKPFRIYTPSSLLEL